MTGPIILSKIAHINQDAGDAPTVWRWKTDEGVWISRTIFTRQIFFSPQWGKKMGQWPIFCGALLCLPRLALPPLLRIAPSLAPGFWTDKHWQCSPPHWTRGRLRGQETSLLPSSNLVRKLNLTRFGVLAAQTCWCDWERDGGEWLRTRGMYTNRQRMRNQIGVFFETEKKKWAKHIGKKGSIFGTDTCFWEQLLVLPEAKAKTAAGVLMRSILGALSVTFSNGTNASTRCQKCMFSS